MDAVVTAKQVRDAANACKHDGGLYPEPTFDQATQLLDGGAQVRCAKCGAVVRVFRKNGTSWDPPAN